MVSAPPSSPSPTPLGRLDASLINRAVHALLKHHSATSSQSTSLFEDELDVQVQLSLLRIPGNSSPKPIRIDIPHSFVKVGRDPDEDDGDTTMQDDGTAGASPPAICLIVKDSLKPALQALLSRFASQSDSSTTLSCIKKILTLTSLRQKHKTFARKRELLAKYDIFLADDRILPMLTKALGKGFFHKKKQPIPICLTRNVPSSSTSSSANETGLILRLEHILRATYLHLSSGTCLTVKAGTTSMSPSRLVENIAAIAEKAPSKVPRKWANVRSISIKTTNSVALPIYNKSPEEIEELLYLARVEKREEGAANGEEEDHGDVDGEDVDTVEQMIKKRKEKKEKRKELAESTPLGRALKKQKSLEKKEKEGKDDTPVEMQDDRDVEDANVEEKEDKTPAESLENEEEKGTARKSKKERKEKKKATVGVVPPENTNQDDDEGDEPNEEKLPTEKPKSSKKKSKKNTKEEDKDENVEETNDLKEKQAADRTEDMLPTETPKSSKKKSKKMIQAEGKDIQAMTQAEGKNVANDQQEEKTTESSAPTKTPKSSKKRKGTKASNDDATDPAVTPATSKNDDKQSTKKKTKELKEQEDETTESSAPTKTPKSSKKRKGTNASNDDAVDPAVTPATSKNDDKQSTKKKTKELKEQEDETTKSSAPTKTPKSSKKRKGTKASDDDATDPAVTPATSKNDDKQSTDKKRKELKQSGPANASPASADAAFIPSKKFQGSKPGYVFRKDKKGLGYYKDVLPVVDKVWLKSLKNAGRGGGGGGGGGGARGGKSKRGVSNTPAKRRKGGSRRSF